MLFLGPAENVSGKTLTQVWKYAGGMRQSPQFFRSLNF